MTPNRAARQPRQNIAKPKGTFFGTMVTGCGSIAASDAQSAAGPPASEMPTSKSRFMATSITTDCATSVQIEARIPLEKQ